MTPGADAAREALYDLGSLIVARTILRSAVYDIKRLRSTDPAIAVLLDQLDELCVDLTSEIETGEPTLI
jgi:hypothetical protein